MYKIYEEKVDFLKKNEYKLEKISSFYAYSKLVVFCAVLVFAYFSYSNFSIINVLMLFLFFALYLMFFVKDKTCRDAIDMLRRQKSVCSKEISYLKGDYSVFDSGPRYINPDHIFSYDLDIFGPSSLFNRINRTVTQNGEKRLAKKLKCISQDEKEIRLNQAAIIELSDLFDWRVKFLANEPVKSAFDIFSGYMLTNKYSNRLISSVAPYASVFLTLVFLVLGILSVLPWFYFMGMFFFQLFVAIIAYKILQKSTNRINGLHKEYSGYLPVLKDIYGIDFKSDKLKKLKKKLLGGNTGCLDAFEKLSNILNLFDQRGNVFAYIIFNGVVLYDIILIKVFIKWGEKYLPHVEEWIDCIAEIDALVSFGTYAFNNPNNTYAQVINKKDEDIIRAVNVYHPFLSDKVAVPNSFVLKKKEVVIVTGANMAGKSTFLRTIGVTYIMASNGMPVCAESFEFTIVSLFSSMRTSDDLSENMSYFNAEILRLKKLMEFVKYNSYTLVILDEILKGTNSKDKLNGSVLFLSEMSKYNASVLVATHDLELAKLEEKDEARYLNYCFEIELSEKVSYSYKIQKGVAQNLNASYLLSNMLKSIQ
ncbi:MutS-related protein [Prosthecochloris sp. SCSIO W1103]|uniref:MutS-related protein n=1 Tax=Prosthecochloris sp. SCSIO W1103 TaxID=2992244 RepID=UPI00223CBCE8|nr:hypothetical protein [Prosthecochloris sp. SCSIO W1103]UZJ36853.1 hypothetical protein OO005_08840 [Prosthecochloris sp. SCSIO W1103]